MPQLTLFDEVRPEPRRVDRCRAAGGPADTSREAAAAVDQRWVSRQAESVLGVLRGRGPAGATAAEIAAELGMEQGIVTARLSELYRHGLAQRTDQRRKNPSGMRAAVIVAVRR